MAKSAVRSRTVNVDGIRTHYLEAGEGPTVVFLHSGEFGGCAEISWEFNLDAFARHFRCIAPDWLGFGRTDKVFDFADGRTRSLEHMRRFLEVMDIREADFVGNSMGGSNLARIAAARPVIFPIRSLVLCPGGGYAPATEARQKLLAYDGTPAAMRALLDGMFFDKRKWVDNAAYIRRRQKYALIPGAWECTSAPRLKRPNQKTAGQFGNPDSTPYESIEAPVLLVAGRNDELREKGYAPKLGKRMQNCTVKVYEKSGHCPHIEHAARFNREAIAFLKGVHRKLGAKRDG
jgi:pimeloyl-ACP methyl ester carboxylesterase